MSPFEQIAKILAQEQTKGCTNALVIGGLEAFVVSWAKRSQNSDDPAQNDLIARLVESMSGYDQADGETRPRMVSRALELAQSALPSPRPRHGRAEQRSKNETAAARPAASRSSSPTPAPRQSAARPRPPAPAEELGDEQASEEEEELRPPTAPRENGFGLDAPVTRLQGVGPLFAKRLEKLGITHVQHLLYLGPRRYDDYSRLKTISELMYGEEATVIAYVGTVSQRQGRGRLVITNVLFWDQTGTINATFYNQPFLSKTLRQGMQVVVHGKVDQYMNRVCFTHPEWDRLDKDSVGIQPVYPLTEGLTARWLRRLVRGAVNYWADKIRDPLPADLRARAGLLDLETALREIHAPSSWEQIEPARRRLAFEELLMLQIHILRQRQKWRAQPGRAFQVARNFRDEVLPGMLPFDLTGAQRRAIGQILDDMEQPIPMHRLLQGDVGSGKTVVALAAMLAAVRDGAQAALMAPTEILAMQHYKGITRLLEHPRAGGDRAPRVRLLIGSLRPAEKERVQAEIAAGEVDIAIGTHALIQEAVNFKDLGVIVIDEQHRFGVTQRSLLKEKGYCPDVLVMSATPIPRTLALTLYGDLDLAILDEMPPGRQTIRTKWLEPRERERAYAFIYKQVREGRQAFIICPLIEESEAIDARAAVEEYERLSKEVYPDLRVGLIHGKLRAGEKDAVMAEFGAGRIDVLVATSVVEVGIDVPNATVMLIEGADRFGLAQLHQFRGRIGRGVHQSYCMLLAEKAGTTANERLKVIEETQDGFRLAEADLQLRGPGELSGVRQSGELTDLKFARLSDIKLMEEARRFAEEIFARDPELSEPQHRLLRQQAAQVWKDEGDLS